MKLGQFGMSSLGQTFLKTVQTRLNIAWWLKARTLKALGLETEHQHPHKKLNMVACACNAQTG